MLLPVRCFTCNRLLADDKLRFFESNKHKKYEDVKAIFQSMVKVALDEMDKLEKDSDVTNELVIYPNELKEEFKYNMSNTEAHFTVSPTSEFLILNLMGIENYCCRRMFLGYVDLIEKIN